MTRSSSLVSRLCFLAALIISPLSPAKADYVGGQAGGGANITYGAFEATINGVKVQFTKSVPVDPATGSAIFAPTLPGYVTITGTVPLPTGAATAAAQAAGNTSAASIDAKTPPLTSAALAQTCTALPAGTSTTFLAQNAARRSLRWQNVGTGAMTVAPGTGAVTVGAGLNYEPPAAAGGQGGGTTFDGAPTPVAAFSAVSTAGTTVCAWEGN